MERNFQTLHTKRKKWKNDKRNANCWAFYYVNDGKKIDLMNL